MKTFSAFDVSQCGTKRSRTSLSEARCLCAALDKEVNKAGRFIGPNVSEEELLELFQLGVVGLPLESTTPTGRGRNINTLMDYVGWIGIGEEQHGLRRGVVMVTECSSFIHMLTYIKSICCWNLYCSSFVSLLQQRNR